MVPMPPPRLRTRQRSPSQCRSKRSDDGQVLPTCDTADAREYVCEVDCYNPRCNQAFQKAGSVAGSRHKCVVHVHMTCSPLNSWCRCVGRNASREESAAIFDNKTTRCFDTKRRRMSFFSWYVAASLVATKKPCGVVSSENSSTGGEDVELHSPLDIVCRWNDNESVMVDSTAKTMTHNARCDVWFPWRSVSTDP